MRRGLVCCAVLMSWGCPSPNHGELLQLVIVSRHGMRTPLEPFDCAAGGPDPSHCLNNWTRRPGGFPQTWNPPGWKHTDAGDLTMVGTALVTLMGGYYGSRLTNTLFPVGFCPESVFIRADVDERTIETAKAIAAGLAGSFGRGCKPVDVQKIDSKPDPLFHPTETGVCELDAQVAYNKIVERLPPGGFATLDAQNSRALDTMQDTLQCCQAAICNGGTCRLRDKATHLTVDAAKDTVKMSGAIGFSSTAAEVFLLEYANAFLDPDVGWGQITAEKLQELLTLHNLEFDYMQRTPYIAGRQGSMLLRAVRDTLSGTSSGTMNGPMPAAGTKFVVYVGHDTNVANLATLLGTDWPSSQELPDKTAPAGALLFELRLRNEARFVHVWYAAQKLEQLRHKTILSISEPPHLVALPLNCADKQGEPNACMLEAFQNLVQNALDRQCVK